MMIIICAGIYNYIGTTFGTISTQCICSIDNMSMVNMKFTRCLLVTISTIFGTINTGTLIWAAFWDGFCTPKFVVLTPGIVLKWIQKWISKCTKNTDTSRVLN